MPEISQGGVDLRGAQGTFGGDINVSYLDYDMVTWVYTVVALVKLYIQNDCNKIGFLMNKIDFKKLNNRWTLSSDILNLPAVKLEGNTAGFVGLF